ncbi:MAG: DegV family protein [Dehalococcoidia bacterium]|nr:DegV family protein [Dehalococcoidia bacterium]
MACWPTFTNAAGKGRRPILSMHITSKLSGTVNSAELAKDDGARWSAG